MGFNDAPNAPAGWYPNGEGLPGERYWDGESWNGTTRGISAPAAETTGETPQKATSLKGWLASLAIVVVVVVVLVLLIPSLKEKPFITTDAEACSAISDAIGAVNAKNYGSVGAITEKNSTEISSIAKSARAGAGTGIYEGTGNKATSVSLVQQLSDFAESMTFGSDLIHASFGNTDPATDPGHTLYLSYQKLQTVVATCSGLGFPLKNQVFNFPVPDATTATATSSGPAPSISNVPEGFTDTGNGIGYKFVELACDFGRCVHYQVYAYKSCPSSVYIEGNQVDAAGVAYGITNDMLGAMSPGDNAVATLRATEPAATAVKITKVQCY